MPRARTVVLPLLLLAPQLGLAQSAHPDSARRAVHAPISGPLRFEPNRGQTDARVKFLSRGPGYRLFLTESDAVFSFVNGTSEPDGLLRLQLGGANTPRSVVAET